MFWDLWRGQATQASGDEADEDGRDKADGLEPSRSAHWAGSFVSVMVVAPNGKKLGNFSGRCEAHRWPLWRLRLAHKAVPTVTIPTAIISLPTGEHPRARTRWALGVLWRISVTGGMKEYC
jgi:hypothetical protein